jgi:uncharacterized membrane protein YadS
MSEAKQWGALEPKQRSKLLTTEDYWSIWLGLAVIFVALVLFWAGSSLKSIAVTPGTWTHVGQIGSDLAKHGVGYLVILLGYGLVFTFSISIMGRSVREFIPGFLILFLGSLAIFYFASWKAMKDLDLGAPLLALGLGLVIGNLSRIPKWFDTSLRTEYYIKTGIVLLGATLPFVLIAKAGWVAFIQATIISITTWFTIYLAATRIFKLDPRFGAVLGTGGAVCGVSGSIAIGGAVRAEKDHIAVGIAVVSVWALVMIFILAFVTKGMIANGTISPGEAGAWIGTSEYADAAGFAVVAELAAEHGDGPIQTFTLMKVIGRDIWIGIWAFILAIVSVAFWEKKGEGGATKAAVGASVIWQRFPKFVIGFFLACAFMSLVAALAPPGHVGKAAAKGTFKTKTATTAYDADFSNYVVPPELQNKFSYNAEDRVISFKGGMSAEDQALLMANADPQQQIALKQLGYKADWFESELQPNAIKPIKALRSWAFVFCFLCIGLSTRFRELAHFGMKPFYAFTIGVLINVPLGYIMSTIVFKHFWAAIH